MKKYIICKMITKDYYYYGMDGVELIWTKIIDDSVMFETKEEAEKMMFNSESGIYEIKEIYEI